MIGNLGRARLFPCAVALLLSACASSRAQNGDVNGLDPARRAAEARPQPGDSIVVLVLREPELTRTVMVTETGEAPFAKLGLLKVDTLTIRQLHEVVRDRYAHFLREPALQITVLRRVAVSGEVRAPNVYMVDISTTLRDVVARAGGVTNEGNRKKVFIVRNGERTHVPNWDREMGPIGDLRSGDQVTVGRKSWLTLNALPAVSTAMTLAFLIVTIQQANK